MATLLALDFGDCSSVSLLSDFLLAGTSDQNDDLVKIRIWNCSVVDQSIGEDMIFFFRC